LPLVNSLVKINCPNPRPHQTSTSQFQFVRTMDLSLVDTTLHNSPDLIIHRIQIWVAQIWILSIMRSGLFGSHILDALKSGVSWCSSSTVARVRSPPVYRLKITKTVNRWTLNDVSMTYWSNMVSLTMLLQYVRVSKKYHSCFVKTMKLLHAFIVHLLNSFCEKKCGCIFQCRPIAATNYRWSGKFNCVCGQIISVLNNERIIKITVFCKSYAQMKVSSFLTHSVYNV